MINKLLSTILLLIFILGTVSGCFLFFSKQQKSSEEPVTTVATQKEDAELILKNLAVGMRLYSTMTGGGGDGMFTGDITKIEHLVMRDAFKACSEKTPYHGFIVELTEYPMGDGYKTNFRFIAKPDKGYIGESFAIDKTEEIIPLNKQENHE